MLDNPTVYAYATAFIFATLGFGYIFDRTYNQSEPEVSSDYYTPDELPVTQDIPNSDDAVPTVASQQYLLDPSEQCCMATPEKSEPPFNSPDNFEAITTSGYRCYASDYRNELWPSPRPVNFVKALVKGDHVQIEGRLSHGKAIEILSSRAQMPPEAFLRTDPITYTRVFMPSQYNAAVLLGQSIQRLEDTIRKHKYLSELRRHG
jgi:hypothetical protein